MASRSQTRKSFILNETSSFLWNILQHNQGAEPEELVKLLARVYQLDESFSLNCAVM